MRKNYIFFLLLSFCLLHAFGEAEESGTKTIQFQPIADQQKEFCWPLFTALNQSSENICISPYSIWNAMALAYIGADGKTKEEIAALFHYPLGDIDTFLEQNKMLQQYLQKTVDSGNALVIDQKLHPQELYMERISKQMLAEVFKLDFLKNPNVAVNQINSWVKKKTQGLIPHLISGDDLDSTTRLVLLNAVYFHGNWRRPFDKGYTQKEYFYADSCNPLLVDMMQKRESMPLFQDHEVSVVIQDFKRVKNEKCEIECMFVLPHRQEHFQTLLQTISSKKVDEWVNNYDYRLVKLFLPKCSLKQRIELQDTFASMGMIEPLSDDANFSQISDLYDEKLKIQKVIHQAGMSITEEGLEAAAATAVIMAACTSCMPRPEDPIEIRFNHPYLVIIREKKTGLVLFIGKVEQPEPVENKK